MKKILLIASIALFTQNSYAQSLKQFPNISGETLFYAQADRVLSSKQRGVAPNNSYLYVQSDISLNFNKNWSVKTQWRLQPNNVLTTRDPQFPERYRTFLSTDRDGLNMGETGLLVEELKAQFENDDLSIFAGKFDPGFGTMWKKSKRIGVFSWQMAEDYNLREKLGAGISAFLENSIITVNGFTNDTTSLSRSAFNDRGRARKGDGTAGNVGGLSSYSISMNGENFLTIDGLYYNIGYRSLDVKQSPVTDEEKGYVIGVEYLYKLGRETNLIPVIEWVKLDNFTGERGRDAEYRSAALIGNYASWTASVSFMQRKIKQPLRTANLDDRQLELAVGYKFTDNLTLDISRADVKESGQKGSLIGAALSYLYKF